MKRRFDTCKNFISGSKSVSKRFGPGIYHGFSKGFTLLELMIVMSIVAIGVALAVPTFQDITQRRNTTSDAEQLAAFLRLAQSDAIKLNQPISVALTHTSASDWCIGANEGNTGCDCEETVTTEADYCSIDDVVRLMDSSEQPWSGMSAHSTDVVFTFDPVRGIMAMDDLPLDHEFIMQSKNDDYALKVDVGVTGRISICTPDETKKVPGYRACS